MSQMHVASPSTPVKFSLPALVAWWARINARLVHPLRQGPPNLLLKRLFP